MRLKKLSLIAAAGLAGCSLFAATSTVTDDLTNSVLRTYTGAENMQVLLGQTLTIDTPDSFTYSNRITGQTILVDEAVLSVTANCGDVVKTGAGTLQIDSYADITYFGGNSFVGRAGATASITAMSDANQGVFRIREGQVVVSGYINQYFVPAGTGLFNDPAFVRTESYIGYNSTVMEGSALLDFYATRRNVPTAVAVLDGQAELVAVPTFKRINYVVNLKAGDNNDQNQTRLNVGDAQTLINVHHTGNSVGSVGYISGPGVLLKTGQGEFRVLNDGDFSGDVYVSDGALSLVSAGGSSLANAKSITMMHQTNVGNVGSAFAAHAQGVGGGNSPAISEWTPALLGTPQNGILNIEGTQSINNLQIYFNRTAKFDDPYSSIQRGAGSSINLKAGSKLIINQAFNGYYEGNITNLETLGTVGSAGVGGDIVKRGAGTLVMISGGANFRNLTIEQGLWITNVQYLGSSTANVEANASIVFVQNNAGTLGATIKGAKTSVLQFLKSTTIKNIEDVDVTVGNGEIGVVDVRKQQTDFTGVVRLSDGLRMILATVDADNKPISAFPNARFELLAGANGEETTLSFADTNQSVAGFSGDAGTRLDLGRGTITLTQDGNTTYAGKVTGTGSLIKAGVGSFTLSGLDSLKRSVSTYSGATVVTEGTLGLANANQLPNTSGLVLAGGVVAMVGDQRFGALMGSGGTVNIGQGTTLTIGMSAAQLTALANSIQSPGAVQVPAAYLGTRAAESVSASGTGYNRDATRAYLQSVGVTDTAVLNDLSFAGKLVGSGSLLKIGTEILALSGKSEDFTGSVTIREGTLALGINALPKASSITVEDDARFAIRSDVDGTVSTTMAGAGDFEKLGSGTVTLTGSLGLTGAIIGSEGKLIITLADGTARDVSVGFGATVEMAQAANVTITSKLTGDGTLAKSGAGVLTFSPASVMNFSGSYLVSGGTLVLPALTTAATSAGNISVIGANSKVIATLTNSLTTTGSFSGSGVIELSAASPATVYTLNSAVAPASAFTGTLKMTGGTVRFGAASSAVGLLSAGRIALAGTGALDLNNTAQSISGLTGTSATTLATGATSSLSVSVAAGRTDDFLGAVTGAGSLTKAGAGTLRLLGTASAWSGSAIVNEGALVATVVAISNANVTVNGTAAFKLHNDFVDVVQEYNGAITTGSATAVLGKTGAGTVNLTTGTAFAGKIHVEQGELRATNTAFTAAAITADAAGIYTVVDAGTDTTTAAKVSGAGSLGFELGTLRLASAPTYAGNTLLRNGARLDLATNVITSISGLDSGVTSDGVHVAGSGSTTQVNAAGALTINQSIAGTFDGTFTGLTSLTVQGMGKLALTNAAIPAAITVDGGKLALDAAATTDVTLANQGSLYFDTTNTVQLYDLSKVFGSGNLVKTGANDLVLDASTVNLNGKLGVDQGQLTLVASAVTANAAVSGLITEGDGVLALDVTGLTSAEPAFAKRISGDGDLLLSGTGLFRVNDATTFAHTGTTTVAAGATLGGTFSMAGSLKVDAGAFLSPGNSPGVDTVAGDVTLNGTLVQEVNATTADRLNAGGMITLGTTSVLDVKQDSTVGSAKAARGQQFVILTAAGGITGTFGNATDGLVQLDDADRAASGLSRVRLSTAVVSGVSNMTMTVSTALSGGGTPGYQPHDGLGGLLAVLDAGAGVSNSVLTAVDGTPVETLSPTINALSPLGLASIYAMSRETALRQEDRLHERMEARRYDVAGEAQDPWEAFVVASGSQAKNDSDTDTPTFDYNTFGGLVGLDTRLESGTVVGGAVGYDSGSATLHQGAGKVEMNRVRAIGFVSTMVTKRWFVDGGLSAGFGDFATTRNTVTGRNTGSTTGVDLGAFVSTGTVVALTEKLHLTPFASLSFAHHEFGAFDETGESANASALKVESWSNDSLRASVGTGLGWWMPSGDMKVKLGLDLALNHELLDTESDIDASFRTGGAKFSTTAAALPTDSISVGPNVTLGIDELTSVSAGYTFEQGFDGRMYNAFNVTFRRRF